MINIHLVNCRSLDVRYIPMYECFLADALKSKIDCNVSITTVFVYENAEKIRSKIIGDDDIIIMWEFFTTKAKDYIYKYFEIAKYLKGQVKNPLFFGGFWSTTHGEYFQEFEIFDYLLKGYNIDRIADKILQYTQAGIKESVVDVEGPLEWDRYDFNIEYLDEPLLYFQRDTFMGYLTSFSCPRNCKFCFANSARNSGAPYAVRSVAKVKKDIKKISEIRSNIKSIILKDLNFFCDTKRAFEIIDYLRSINIDSSIHLDITIYDINKEFLLALEAKKICSELFFGLESFNEVTRKKVAKPFSDTDLIETFDLVEKYGINLTGNIILGLPWQEMKDVEESIAKAVAYMREYKHIYISMNVLKPEYGTEIQTKYFPDLHKQFTFNEIVKLYNNQATGFQTKLFGEKFKSINLEWVHLSIAMILRVKRKYYATDSKFKRIILNSIWQQYEALLKPPCFRWSLVRFTLHYKVLHRLLSVFISILGVSYKDLKITDIKLLYLKLQEALKGTQTNV